MAYRLLADVVLLLHLSFVLFVVLGGLLLLRWRWLMWLHLPAAAWGAIIEFAGWRCPLTPLEQALRRMGGEAGYAGGFIDHYIASLVYPEGLNRAAQIVLGLAVIAINAIVYWRIFTRARHDPGR
jgi:hypothetical protein